MEKNLKEETDAVKISITHQGVLTNNMTDEEILAEFEEEHGYKARSLQEAKAYNALLMIGHLMDYGKYGNWK